MPEESDASIYRRLFFDVWRAHYKLQSDHESLMRTLFEELPKSERARVLEKYDTCRAKLWEETLLKLEESQPTFAAELDKDRPLMPPDEKGGSS